VAFLVLRIKSTCQISELQLLCNERLARFKIPKHFLVIDATEIPVTPSGRARKFLLSKIACESLGLTSH